MRLSFCLFIGSVFHYLMSQNRSSILIVQKQFMEAPLQPNLKSTQPTNGCNDKKEESDKTDELGGEIVEPCIKINGEMINKVYKKISLLGKGGFAECYLTQQKGTDKQVATKIISKKLLDSSRTKIRLANQIKLHKSLRHENVVEFYSNFEDSESVYINLEVCCHGSINDIIRYRRNFSVPEVQSMIYGICHGLKYLHSRHIIHRDLKLGNIFLDSNLKAKIGDFGLACKLEFAKQFKRTVCGTPNYIAPEVLDGKGYYFEVDVWAVGAIIYTLFFGVPPFETETPQGTYEKIKKCEYFIPKYNQIPMEAIDLIRRILVTNPSKRYTLDQILQSPFMKIGGYIPLGLPAISLKRPVMRKQLTSWPKIITATEEQASREMNSTFLGFFGPRKSEKIVINKDDELEQPTKLSTKQVGCPQESSVQVYCRTFQQTSEKLAICYINNGNVVAYDLAASESYTIQVKEKTDRSLESVRKLRYVDSATSLEEQQIEINSCEHKIQLSLKMKEVLQAKLQVQIPANIDKIVTISKIQNYKDILMIKFTNRAIQIMYKEKDGFLLNSNRKNVLYFRSFADNQVGKEVSLVQLLAEKQNRVNGSMSFAISSIFKQKKNDKHFLTMKKINYLKVILTESMGKHSKKFNTDLKY